MTALAPRAVPPPLPPRLSPPPPPLGRTPPIVTVPRPVTPPPVPPSFIRPKPRTAGQQARKAAVGIGAFLLLFGKLLGKLKFLVLPILKFFPVLLKTGGTMLLTIWFYAKSGGWMYAVGLVLLIFIHECGHLVAARRVGLKVGAPVFIPFLGAFIALKEAPRNAWIEAQVGIGGPLLGTVGAALCGALFFVTGDPRFLQLAYTGFSLNLFNLAPIGFLDGGRIVTALSPWLWLLGLVLMGASMAIHPNFIVFLILLMSAPRLFFLFRKKTAEEARYFEVTPGQRWLMALLYFGLIAFLVLAMRRTYIAPNAISGGSSTFS
jgi:Zn-dependent protease